MENSALIGGSKTKKMKASLVEGVDRSSVTGEKFQAGFKAGPVLPT